MTRDKQKQEARDQDPHDSDKVCEAIESGQIVHWPDHKCDAYMLESKERWILWEEEGSDYEGLDGDCADDPEAWMYPPAGDWIAQRERSPCRGGHGCQGRRGGPLKGFFQKAGARWIEQLSDNELRTLLKDAGFTGLPKNRTSLDQMAFNRWGAKKPF